MAMSDRWDQAVADPHVGALLRGVDTVLSIQGSSWSVVLSVSDGRIRRTEGGEGDREPRFVLRATDEVWDLVLAEHPAPGWQSPLHLVRTGSMVVEGDEREYLRHLHVVRAVIEAARHEEAIDAVVPRRPLSAVGTYHRVHSALGTADVYVERCGSGPQLLALATAGSDTSQWHGLITETDVTDRYELITVDLPWHGRSSPIFGDPAGSWTLTPARYTDFIVAVADALELPCPTLVGASMAGAAVVHALATHQDRFAGAVACQVGHGVGNRAVAELRAADIDASVFVPEWTYGLMNPASPSSFRTRVWWGYSSGGHGLYAADIDSYQQWRFEEVAALLTSASPHIAVLSGSYDTSVPPEASRALAAAIPNASFAEMPELGHFPHAENPGRFAPHLESALRRVAAHPSRSG
ncbi:alpha/beta hydrolase [Microbacterium sp. NPDC028030]|uniref:alpha/beta fold hydrolase n=1 Tax=Microbacterium sp. NPDC028030 TaxID=3155124 RepID=UPI0033F752CA